ncbi:hypothetical protein ACFVZR_38430 [Streptomyces sp. NPDC058316]|uniref:hypothetical protein n=1 Tax=unclassified Streptomyces TaxID=2593676 RepID=UPI0034370764
MTPVRHSVRLLAAPAGVLVLTTACTAQSGSDTTARQRTAPAGPTTPSPAKSPTRAPTRSPADPAADRDLLRAARSGATDAVRDAIERGADPETRDEMV